MRKSEELVEEVRQEGIHAEAGATSKGAAWIKWKDGPKHDYDTKTFGPQMGAFHAGWDAAFPYWKKMEALVADQTQQILELSAALEELKSKRKQ